MLPSKEIEENTLVCNLCGKTKQLNDEIIDSYTFNTVIKHPQRKA